MITTAQTLQLLLNTLAGGFCGLFVDGDADDLIPALLNFEIRAIFWLAPWEMATLNIDRSLRIIVVENNSQIAFKAIQNGGVRCCFGHGKLSQAIPSLSPSSR